ncbi:PCNA-interacting partner-like [Mercenaria mercenaria]|uniref:PCNA-interacting partner-like n=1 Tax=Mercenaria mercenaria TaxID=6596 RepID=UPI00234ED397|nr:PCNA-interacting partner-like [Mercenaria mercenaria]XP_053394105.1 PCNA-interacting partner-like [Mercenaria mercenaria]XP_053394106.1 PCNA-interacting partner-like [Mercenaria mercenaria]XP_053394107.1 PCNA-interacting partner-like [Mercenaria mercenaria]XP_053394108.1 PCNA-interacting partner-like [Mercenaria mercenaria]
MPENPDSGNHGDETGSVFFLSNCDAEIVRNSLDTVISHVIKDRKDPVVISSKRQLTALTNIQGYHQYFMSLCRKLKLLQNDRVTLLSPMDQLIVIQLCLAEKSKQETGEFDVETSIVMQASKDISSQKLLSQYDITSCSRDSGICELYDNFLQDCNYKDGCDVFNVLKEEMRKNEDLQRQIKQQNFVILDQPKSALERKMLELLSEGKDVKSVTVEVPLDSEDNIFVTIDSSCLAARLDLDVPLSTVKKTPSITEAYVRLVFLSYLELLVNSRSELALARVINVPERELTHSAFTDLKHESRERKMTMYQTATSFIMKIRLGGKGYAPDPNHPLGAHVKGIGEFVSLMHRMETVIEEDPDIRSACRRTVNIIKREMLKCRDSKIRNSSVESVADLLHTQITDIIDQLDTQIVVTPDKSAANGGSLTSRRARKALRQLLDKLATVDDDMATLDHLTDIYSSQRTPLRFPSVISQFRSPEEELEVTSPGNKYNLSLSERVLNITNKTQTPVYAKRYKSTYDWAEPVHHVELQKDIDAFSSSQVYVIPSKTIVHAGNKLSSGQAAKVLESMLDKENVVETDTLPVSVRSENKGNEKAGTNIQGVTKQSNNKKKTDKQSKKRQLPDGNQSSQPEKRKKQDQSKTCRRKLLPQVKGQQSLAKFFRV